MVVIVFAAAGFALCYLFFIVDTVFFKCFALLLFFVALMVALIFVMAWLWF